MACTIEEGDNMSEFDTLSDIRSYLANEFEMGDDDANEMIEMLIDSLISQIQQLKDALKSNDTEAIGHIGHAIKGSAANIGAKHISETGEALDTPEAKADSAKCAELITDLEKSLEHLEQLTVNSKQ